MKKNENYNKKIGKEGEDRATEYLEKQGYIILNRNYVTNSGEIDIIAKDKNEYVFIEVKSRTTNKYGIPVESINKDKMNHILISSQYYICRNGLNSEFIRFDVIEIYMNNKKININHIKNVFF